MLSTPVHEFSSAMAQAFAIAIVAWTSCFVITIVISLATKAKPADELRGLVYSLTEKPKETGVTWYLRPAPLAVAVLVAVIALNFVLR